MDDQHPPQSAAASDGHSPDRWHVSVDPDLCRASGMCVGVAPRYFALTDDNVSQPISATVAPDPVLREAEEMCPVRAITVEVAAESAVSPGHWQKFETS